MDTLKSMAPILGRERVAHIDDDRFVLIGSIRPAS
jgi:hypothetical protein